MAGGRFRVRGTALAGDTVPLWMLLLSVGFREFLRLHHAQSAEETSSSISCDSEVATSTFVHQSSGWERGRNRHFPFSHCYRRRTGLLYIYEATCHARTCVTKCVTEVDEARSSRSGAHNFRSAALFRSADVDVGLLARDHEGRDRALYDLFCLFQVNQLRKI